MNGTKVNEFGHEMVTISFETTKEMKEWIEQYQKRTLCDDIDEAVKNLVRAGLIQSGYRYEGSLK